MSNYAKHLSIVIAAIVSSFLIQNPLQAETYKIKKLNTPTIRINDKDMTVGDSFSDGAVVKWSSDTQAMRVLSGHNEVLNINSTGGNKPIRMRSIVASLGKLSTRALPCTSPAEHKQAFEGEGNNGHILVDTIYIASSWRQDSTSYFEMLIKQDDGERVVQLPSNNNGEVMIDRSMFGLNDSDEEANKVSVGIRYRNGAKGKTREITPAMNITILPSFK